MLNKIKVIFWDFDGVLMNSNEVRDLGFRNVLIDYPIEQVEKLMEFHKENGGLSRYVKFRYFFEEIVKKEVSDDEILLLANQFSKIMKELLLDKSLLIEDSMSFVMENYNSIPMHIVSGSDQVELRYLCESLKINQYFKSILGSPTPKNTLVKEVLLDNKYTNTEVVLIGDSINDFEAATANNIGFIGYNNLKLKSLAPYLDNFRTFKNL